MQANNLAPPPSIAPAVFFSSRRRHTRFSRDWSSDVCSSDLVTLERIRIESSDESGPEHRDVHKLKNQDLRFRMMIHCTNQTAGLISRFSLKKIIKRSEERRVGKEWRERRAEADDRREEGRAQ